MTDQEILDVRTRGHDDVSRLRRFCPRTSRSGWSASNAQRVQRLVDSGRLREAGLRQVEAAKAHGRWPTT